MIDWLIDWTQTKEGEERENEYQLSLIEPRNKIVL